MRNKRKQISAFIMLALLVIYTVLSQDLFVYAKQEEEVGISSKEKHIVGFSILDDNIQQQILPLGASETDIIFPDTLTVTVALSSTNTLPIQSTVEDQKLSETASPTPSPVEKTNVSDVPGEVDAQNEKTLITLTPNSETGNLPDIQNNEILVEKETVNNDVLYSEIDPQEIKTLIQTEEIVLSNIVWKLDVDKSDSSEFISDETAIGYNYVYTPVLPETDNEGNSLILDEDAILPEIYVTIEKQNIMMMNSTAAISGSCGENLTYSITGDESDGYVLTISGTGAMCNYEDTQAGATTAPWYAYNENLKTLIIEEGITSIGENAFKGCWGFKGELVIPDSVTTIEKSAFQSCNGFEKLHLSNKLKSIGQYAFLGCANINGKLELPEGIESIGYHAFDGCFKLSGDLVIPSSVTYIGDFAFYWCTGLGENVYIKSKSLVIGEKAFWTKTITTIYGEPGSDAERYAKTENLEFKERVSEGFSVGDGSIDNPYLISDKEELLYFEQSVNNGTNYADKYIALSNDIYLNSVTDYDLWSEDNAPNSKWEGITGFAGTFDGREHTIYGIYINRSEDNTGFFNEFNNLSKVVIKNVNFKNIYVVGSNNVGGIVGKADYVQIENCSVSGKIKGTGDNVGGFIGYSGSPGHRGTRVYDCTNSAIVEGSNYVGGITGQSYIGNPVGAYDYENVGGTEMIVLKNCKNEGNIIGNSDYVGGIAGYLNRSMNCGGLDIDNLSNSGSVIGNNNVGGIIGYLRSWVGSLGETTIDCCSNKGSITGNSSIAGIIGNSYWSGGTGIKINNIYNVGTITGNDSVTGGIIGRANGGNNIACVYNVGKIVSDNGGALIGYSTGAIFTNAYYSVDEEDSVNGNGAVKLTKEELKRLSSFINFDFSSIWKMTNDYPVFRWEDGEETDFSGAISSDNYIIEEVKKYTDLSNPYDALNRILKMDISNRAKFNLLNELFANYGITDIQEGFDYVTDITSHRRSFSYITTNENFCAYDYYEWLFTTARGFAARSSLYTSALIFNYELFEYTDIMTYASKDLPGVKKCKKLLLQVMDADSTGLADDSIKNINDTKKFCKNMLIINDIVEDDELKDIIDKFDSCTSDTERLKLLEKCINNVYQKVVSKPGFVEGKDVLYIGTEGIAEAMDWSSNILCVTTTGAEDILSIIRLDEDIKKYKNYEKFLTTISTNVDISADMRKAASELLDEIYNGYEVKVTKLFIDLFDCYTKFDDMLETDVVKLISKGTATAESGTVAGALDTIKLSAYIVNMIGDMGSFTKEAFYLQGYAELSIIYNNIVLEDATKFRKNPTAENAWTFFEDYTMLWNLRCLGERQYADLFKLKVLNLPLWGEVFECHLSGYDDAYDTTEGIIQNLNTCKFSVADGVVIPAGVQYVKKAVINCPVDVFVYNEQNEIIAILRDGEKSDIENQYGRFAVVYQPTTKDYAKVICQLSDEKLKFELKANASGIVNFMLNDGNNLYSFNNVVVDEETEINIENNTYSIDRDGDGIAEEKNMLNKVDVHDNNPVQEIIVNDDYFEMKKGEKYVPQVSIEPQNATFTMLGGISYNNNVITYKNGVIQAVGVGETKLCLYSLENSEINKEITVKVLENDKKANEKEGLLDSPNINNEASNDYEHSVLSDEENANPYVPAWNAMKGKDDYTSDTLPNYSINDNSLVQSKIIEEIEKNENNNEEVPEENESLSEPSTNQVTEQKTTIEDSKDKEYAENKMYVVYIVVGVIVMLSLGAGIVVLAIKKRK